MSLEHFITDIKRLVESINLDEGFSDVKRKYCEQGIPIVDAEGKPDVARIPLESLKRLAKKYDPTYPNPAKYTMWIADRYFEQRNARGLEAVKTFDEYLKNPNSKIQQRSIDQYKTVEDLHHEVDAASSRIASSREEYKEKAVRKLLIKANGSVDLAFKWAAGEGAVRTVAAENGEELSAEEISKRAAEKGRGSLVREYGIDFDYIVKLKKKLEKEEAGIFGRDFTIDEDILKNINPDDIVADLPKVVIVSINPPGKLTKEIAEIKSEIAKSTDEDLKAKLGTKISDLYAIADADIVKKSQLYGKDPDYNPKDPGSRDAAWCISYFKPGRTNQMVGGAGYHSKKADTFYFILPKSVDFVPEKKFTKVCVEIAIATGKRNCQKCDNVTGISGYDEKCEKCGATIKAAPIQITVWDWNDSTIPSAEWKSLFKDWGIPIPKTSDRGY